MSCRTFQDDCEGCHPALIDAETGETVPRGSAGHEAVMAVWRASSLMERKSFHAVCVLNSREPVDLALAQPLVYRMVAALSKVKGASAS